MTVGFLAFPLCLPGTAVWRGRQGRLYILSILRVAAAQSKAAMQARSRAALADAAQSCSNIPRANVAAASKQSQVRSACLVRHGTSTIRACFRLRLHSLSKRHCANLPVF